MLPDDIEQIRTMLAQGMRNVDIASAFDVTDGLIANIKSGAAHKNS